MEKQLSETDAILSSYKDNVNALDQMKKAMSNLERTLEQKETAIQSLQEKAIRQSTPTSTPTEIIKENVELRELLKFTENELKRVTEEKKHALDELLKQSVKGSNSSRKNNSQSVKEIDGSSQKAENSQKVEAKEGESSKQRSHSQRPTKEVDDSSVSPQPRHRSQWSAKERDEDSSQDRKEDSQQQSVKADHSPKQKNTSHRKRMPTSVTRNTPCSADFDDPVCETSVLCSFFSNFQMVSDNNQNTTMKLIFGYLAYLAARSFGLRTQYQHCLSLY